MRELRDRVAAVTGAASGIGRALALALADEGCHVALSDVDAAGLEPVRAEAERRGVRATARRVDVADREAVFAWADAVAAEHGRVNLVFNNAGVALGATLRNVTFEEFEWLMAIDFWGVVYGTRAFLPHLERAGEGHVVNVSSVFGLIGFPGNGTYCAAKFAVRGFTETLREELALEGSSVTASCVHPGGIKTSIARNSRLGQNEPELRDRETLAAEFERMARTTPERAAQVILAGVRRNRSRILIGPDARLLHGLLRLFPVAYQRALVSLVRRRMPETGAVPKVRPPERTGGFNG